MSKDYGHSLSIEKLTLGARAILYDMPFTKGSLSIKAQRDFDSNALIVSLRARILACKLCEESLPIFTEVPASWWQHFKRDILKVKNFKTRTITTHYKMSTYLKFPYAAFTNLSKDFPMLNALPELQMYKGTAIHQTIEEEEEG